MSIESEAPPRDPAIDPDLEPPRPQETRRVVGELIDGPKPGGDVTELTPEERADFTKLMTVGRRTKKVVVMDHPLTIQTLKTADEMRIGLYTKDYLETQGFSRAYQVGVCAAGIVEIDGGPVYVPLSEETSEDVVFAKTVEILGKYYPIVISQIYDAIIALEREFADLVIKLGKIPG
jgi:hypothetical protein